MGDAIVSGIALWGQLLFAYCASIATVVKVLSAIVAHDWASLGEPNGGVLFSGALWAKPSDC